MPAILKNPLTAARDARHREGLRALFGEVAAADEDRILSLRPYLTDRPQRFFDRDVYEYLIAWLTRRHVTQHRELATYLRISEPGIDRAFLFLREINAASWHDEIGDSRGEFELVRFIDRTVNPTYLRLVEGVLIPLARVVAHFSRVDRGAGADGLDVWPVVEELRRNQSGILVASYRHVMRNGIAHGGVTYLQNEIRYRDKRGNEETFANPDVIRTTDDLVDVCNGLAAALKVFLIVNQAEGYSMPRELLIEELREETKAPWWFVEGCVESEIGERSQLLIYAGANSRDYGKVQFAAIQTGILAESLVPGYDRYFLSIRSPVAWPGWVAFHGERLRSARESGPTDISHYKGVVEGEVFYVPRRPLGRFRRKLDTLWQSLKIAWPQTVNEFRERLGGPQIVCRGAQLHRNAWGGVLRGSVVIENLRDQQMTQTVWRFRGHIIRVARRAAVPVSGSPRLLHLLPLAFAQVAVYRRDYRVRRLASFGLDGDLICTVRFQRMNRIRSPDLLGSTVETEGSWRIAWNRAWRESLKKAG